MKKEAPTTTMVVKDICCDICNESVIPSARMQHSDDLNSFSEHAQLIASFGYGSKRDGDKFHYDLCEDCFDQLLVSIEGLRMGKT
ncbi:MAG: hypothetical protein JJU03_13985 [Idiomarina sp.]|nr:hypothetical protein [Idiomarina sp.]